MTRSPEPDFTHLLSLSGPYGTFEHAEHAAARVEHGYCSDDVARVLLVTSREREPSAELQDLARSSLAFLGDAQSPDGRFTNRRSSAGVWCGPATNEDCWGRALWSLGTVVARSHDDELAHIAMGLFDRSCRVVSPWPRAMAFATFGAAEVLNAYPEHRGAYALVRAAATLLDRPEPIKGWRWFEERLTYANAALPEAMLVAGVIADNDRLIESGLRQLTWLLDMASHRGHLSVTPASGRRPGVAPALFDQQPIEAAAMSDACLRAHGLTGDEAWLTGHELAVGWFLGDNDAGAAMFSSETGGGYDGLTATGPNLNQGAESTLALLATLQQAHHLQRAR